MVAVVGNPRRGSRTHALTEALTARFGRPFRVIDLADDPRSLLDPSDAVLEERLALVAEARMLVVASPTYRGTYTGLLKLFLDQLPSGGLRGKVAIPVMVAAAPQHALAADLHLRPLLIELGASCPTESLFVLEDAIADSNGVVSTWLESSAPQIERALA